MEISGVRKVEMRRKGRERNGVHKLNGEVRGDRER